MITSQMRLMRLSCQFPLRFCELVQIVGLYLISLSTFKYSSSCGRHVLQLFIIVWKTHPSSVHHRVEDTSFKYSSSCPFPHTIFGNDNSLVSCSFRTVLHHAFLRHQSSTSNGSVLGYLLTRSVLATSSSSVRASP